MENKIKVAIIGLDTSHAVEFPKLMQDPAVPEQNQVHDLQQDVSVSRPRSRIKRDLTSARLILKASASW